MESGSANSRLPKISSYSDFACGSGSHWTSPFPTTSSGIPDAASAGIGVLPPEYPPVPPAWVWNGWYCCTALRRVGTGVASRKLKFVPPRLGGWKFSEYTGSRFCWLGGDPDVPEIPCETGFTAGGAITTCRRCWDDPPATAILIACWSFPEVGLGAAGPVSTPIGGFNDGDSVNVCPVAFTDVCDTDSAPSVGFGGPDPAWVKGSPPFPWAALPCERCNLRDRRIGMIIFRI